MKIEKLHLLSLLILTIFISACTAPSPDALSEQEREQKRLLQHMLKDSSYLYEGHKTLRFLEGRFAIYEDASFAPISYGKTRIENREVLFLSKSRKVKHSIDINATHIRLYTTNKETILTKQSEKDFYKPEDYFQAIQYGTVDDVLRLYDDGLSFNDANDLGALPLGASIYHDREEIFKFLITHGVDVFGENANGNTALDVAVETKSLSMIRLLMKYGVKDELKECDKLIPLVQKDLSFQVARLLIQSGMSASCDNSSLLFWVIDSPVLAANHQTLSALDFLLAHYVKLDVVSLDQGDTPLMRAAAVGNEKVLLKLIDTGINMQVKDKFGRTALDYDSLYLPKKNPNIFKYLQEAGLHTGLKADSDALYKEALLLLGEGDGLAAYRTFKELSHKYKQKRFYKGWVESAAALKSPTMPILKELIETFAYLNQDESEFFYLSMIRFYQKMLPLCHKKEDLDRNRNYLEGSVWFVYEKIDRMYELLYEKYPKVLYLYDRWKNYKNMTALKPLKRKDIVSSEGLRFVGETLDGLPFGKGALRYRDGAKYYGHVFNFIRHGKGKITYANGQIYDGEWIEDKKEGQGFFTDETNALYLGAFSNDIQTGDKKLVRAGR